MQMISLFKSHDRHTHIFLIFALTFIFYDHIDRSLSLSLSFCWISLTMNFFPIFMLLLRSLVRFWLWLGSAFFFGFGMNLTKSVLTAKWHENRCLYELLGAFFVVLFHRWLCFISAREKRTNYTFGTLNISIFVQEIQSHTHHKKSFINVISII